MDTNDLGLESRIVNREVGGEGVSVDYEQYFERAGKRGDLAGGVSVLPIATPFGEFEVWTKRTGIHPDVALLLLHDGPGDTHEYFTSAASFLPAAGVEYHYYDQLGSGYLSVPDEASLWTNDRFVDEVEQVRQGLGLGPKICFLLGHSWGGVLAFEYALRCQQYLRASLSRT